MYKVTKALVARVPKKFSDYFTDCEIYAKEPTFPKGGIGFLNHIDTFACLSMGLTYYSHDWTNWEWKTYSPKFKMHAAYSPNAFREGIPPDFDPEKIIDVYQRFSDSLCDYLVTHLGKVIIKHKTKEAYYFEDSQHYLELFSEFDDNGSSQPYEYELEIHFSKVVTSASGRKSAKLYNTTSSVHKTGTKMSMNDFIAMVRENLRKAYDKIVDGRFSECLQGK